MKRKELYISHIFFPQGIVIRYENGFLSFFGSLGSTALNISKIDKSGKIGIKIEKDKNRLTIISYYSPLFKVMEKLIKNKIRGVTQGFLIYLRIIGVGYRARLEKNTLHLKVGYSHDVFYTIPSSIRLFLIQPTLLGLFGLDKNQVNPIAAKIRKIRPPSPYKGKGIRLVQEKIILKEGKQKQR